VKCVSRWAKLNNLGLSVKEVTTEFCRSVAAVVAVASSSELVAHPFGV
jgi:pterin-4a-carbinolamine dehydratase